MTEEERRRRALQQYALTNNRSLLSRVAAQINPFDRGATYKNPAQPQQKQPNQQPNTLQKIKAQVNPFDNGATYKKPVSGLDVAIKSLQASNEALRNQTPKFGVLAGNDVLRNKVLEQNQVVNFNAGKEFATGLRDQGVSALREQPRNIVSAAITPRGGSKYKEGYDPSKFGALPRFLLGTEKIQPATQRYAGTREELLKGSLGSSGQRFATPLAAAGVIGSIGADVLPGVGELKNVSKGVVVKLAKQEAEDVVKRTLINEAGDVAQRLSEKQLNELAKKVSKTTDKKEVENLIKQASSKYDAEGNALTESLDKIGRKPTSLEKSQLKSTGKDVVPPGRLPIPGVPTPTPTIPNDLKQIAPLQQVISRSPTESKELVQAVKRGKLSPIGEEAKLSSLRLGSDTAGEFDPKTVAQYAAEIQAGKTIDPLVVREEDGQLLVQDGKHRLAAMQALGIDNVPVVREINTRTKPVTKQLSGAAQQSQLSKNRFGFTSLKGNEVGSIGRDVRPNQLEDTVQAGQGATRGILDSTSSSTDSIPRGRFGIPDNTTKEEMQALLDQGRNFTMDTLPTGKLREFETAAKKDPQVRELLTRLSNARNASNVEASLTANTIKSQADNLGVKLDQDFINRYQAGELITDEEKAVGAAIQRETDRLFEKQKALTPDIEYRKNYVPQSYKQDETQVENAVNQLRTQTGADQSRVFNTYEEAQAYGLTPRYNTLDQMVGTGAANVERAAANKQVIDYGIKSGLFTPKGGSGLIQIQGITSPSGETLYAKKELADIINGATQKQTGGLAGVLDKTAKFASTSQDIALQGGIPGTNANFFVAGQAVKDTTRNIGAAPLHPIRSIKQETNLIKDLTRGKQATQARFAENADFIREMASRGVPISAQSSLSSDGKGIVAKGWNALGNNPTFGRYLPNRMLSTSQEVYQQSVKKLGEEKALQLAADTTKNYFGIMDELAKGRSTLTSDAMATALFAPKYRESIINVLGKTLKSLSPTTYGDKSLQANRQLAAGMLATFAAYELMNRKITGHSMFQNREGQELSLQIPYGEKDAKGDQKVINIPFMPGFTTIPRALYNAGDALINGNPKGVIGEASKGLSVPFAIGGAVINNKDYFSRPIYNDQAVADAEGINPDSPLTAGKKIAGYVGGQLSPAWVRGIGGAMGGKPLEQNVATALEAPVRFGKVTNPDRVGYAKGLKEVQKNLDKNEKSAWATLHPKQTNIEGEDIFDENKRLTKIEKAGIYLQHPKVFEADRQLDAINRSQGKPGNPIYDLTKEQVNKVLLKDAKVPGSKDPELDKLYSQPWYQDYKTAQSNYFNQVKQNIQSQLALAQQKGDSKLSQKLGETVAKINNPTNPYPQTPPELQKAMDFYSSLPKGTGERSDFIKSNPALWKQITDQWALGDAWENKERVAIGLSPIDNTQDTSKYAKKGSGSDSPNAALGALLSNFKLSAPPDVGTSKARKVKFRVNAPGGVNTTKKVAIKL